MKPSRYTFLVVPNHDGKNRRFSISRRGTIFILFTTITVFTTMVLCLVYMIPKALDQQRMKIEYDLLIGERSKVLTLYRDLERLKEVERMLQKALGTNLGESKALGDKLVDQSNSTSTVLDSMTFIPSLLPVDGIVTQEMIDNHENDSRKHFGIDIAVPIGSSVSASASGQVVFAGHTTELGNLVVIYHGNEYFTYYGHNTAILVNPYQQVMGGDEIAKSGNTGESSGPHLHLEIWKEGEAVDPLLYFPTLNQSNMSVDKHG